jgi:hypothetical protein
VRRLALVVFWLLVGCNDDSGPCGPWVDKCGITVLPCGVILGTVCLSNGLWDCQELSPYQCNNYDESCYCAPDQSVQSPADLAESIIDAGVADGSEHD